MGTYMPASLCDHLLEIFRLQKLYHLSSVVMSGTPHCQVPQLMKKWAGKERKLVGMLLKKYVENSRSDNELLFQDADLRKYERLNDHPLPSRHLVPNEELEKVKALDEHTDIRAREKVYHERLKEIQRMPVRRDEL